MTANPLTALADRVQALTSACREMDLAIELAIRPDGKIAGLMQFPRGFDGHKGTTWQIYQGAVCYETRNEQGCCYSNGGYPLPAVTGSLDAAMTLLLPGWEWEITNLYGHAQVNLPLNSSERGWQQVTRKDDNVILASVECILRARAALENSNG